MINIFSLVGFLSITQFEEDWTDIIWDLVDTGLETIAQVTGALWDAFWGFIESWVNMNNAFWITLVLIMILSVYIVLRKAGLA